MNATARLTTIAVLLTGTFFATATLACETSAWNGGTTAGAMADDPTNNVSRVNGFCALEVTDFGQVADNSPTAETTFIARFYVFPKNLSAGTYELLVALSDEGNTDSDVFVVTYDGTNITIDATAAGGNSASAPADATHWNVVEVSWTSDGAVDSGGLWVNSDARTDPADATFTPGSGVIEQVRMGAVDGINMDTAFFDDYESHRSLPVGPLLAGDGNSDGNINSGDVDKVVAEFLFSNLANGVPDCNLDGSVNSGDIDCVVAIFLNL